MSDSSYFTINDSLLNDLSNENPFICKINTLSSKPLKHVNHTHTMVVYGLDSYGILSHIVGAISLEGISIISAQSQFRHIKNKKYFHNEFTINAHSPHRESWTESIKHIIEFHGKNIHNANRIASIQYTIEKIAEDCSKKRKTPVPLPVIDINIQKTPPAIFSHNKHTYPPNTFYISVSGYDSQYLLYMLSLAFEIQNMSILSFHAHTHHSHIQDFFAVVPLSRKAFIQTPTLRLQILLSIQFAYSLKQVSDPSAALFHFEEILQTISKNKNDVLLLQLIQSNSIPSFAQILGESKHLWEDFIRVHSEEIIKTFSQSSTTKNHRAFL